MKKTIAIFTLIFALLLTTGCAASNAAQEPMEARIIDVQPAANPIEEVVDEQTEAPTEAPMEAPTEAPTEKPASDEPTAIGKEKALQIALEHAGVDAAKATQTKVEYDAEDGEYDVEFRYNNYEYDYAIHVTTGKVLKHEKEYDDPVETKPKETEKAATKSTEKATQATKATEAAKTLIGKDKAKAIALDHAGVSSSKAANVKVEYDKEDKEYEVDFRAGDYEYDYTIAAYSGKILSHDKEYDPVETKPKETQPKETALIGKDKAKSIALKHAGFSAGDVTGLQVEFDKDDGVSVYEVEFNKDRKEYTYEIHGETGKILSWEIDD